MPINGFPTGLRVSDEMQHAGPRPAAPNFGATSVGTMPDRRILLPVFCRNAPSALLPDDLAGMAAP